jgi:hypothetical protein
VPLTEILPAGRTIAKEGDSPFILDYSRNLGPFDPLAAREAVDLKVVGQVPDREPEVRSNEAVSEAPFWAPVAEVMRESKTRV